MITGAVVNTVIADFVQILTPMGLMGKPFFDNDLGPTGKLISSVVKIDNNFLKDRPSTQKNWLVLTWGRSGIRSYPSNDRVSKPMVRKPTTPSPTYAEVYGVRQGIISLYLQVLSNSSERAEGVEEFFHVFKPEKTYDVAIPDYPDFGTFRATVQSYTSNGLVKLDHQQFGTLSIFQLNLDINYPVIVLQDGQAKLILETTLTVYTQ